MTGHRKTLIRIVALVLFTAAAISAAWYFGAGEHVGAGQFRRWIGGFGPWEPVIFVAGYAVLVTFGFPALALSVAGGLLFGRGLGTALNVTGAVIGASGAFWAARFLARDLIEGKFKGMAWYEKFSEGVRKNGFYYLLFARLVPVFPFNGINYAAGLTRIPFGHFFFGTVIGILPHAFVLTNAAVEAGESAAQGFRLTPGLMIAFTLFAIFGIVPVLVKKYLDRRAG